MFQPSHRRPSRALAQLLRRPGAATPPEAICRLTAHGRLVLPLTADKHDGEEADHPSENAEELAGVQAADPAGNHPDGRDAEEERSTRSASMAVRACYATRALVPERPACRGPERDDELSHSRAERRIARLEHARLQPACDHVPGRERPNNGPKVIMIDL